MNLSWRQSPGQSGKRPTCHRGHAGGQIQREVTPVTGKSQKGTQGCRHQQCSLVLELARATPDKLKDIAGVEPGEVDLAAAKSAHQELANKRGIADACGWC